MGLSDESRGVRTIGDGRGHKRWLPADRGEAAEGCLRSRGVVRQPLAADRGEPGRSISASQSVLGGPQDPRPNGPSQTSPATLATDRREQEPDPTLDSIERPAMRRAQSRTAAGPMAELPTWTAPWDRLPWLMPMLFRNCIPAGLDLAQQLGHLIEQCGIVVQIRLQELIGHILIE